MISSAVYSHVSVKNVSFSDDSDLHVSTLNSKLPTIGNGVKS